MSPPTPKKTAVKTKTMRAGSKARPTETPDAIRFAGLAPLFMWAGGKRRLIPKYAELIPNPSDLTHYVEPFLGGGALFAHLAAQRPGLPASLGDINSELIRLYAMVRDDPDSLIAACQALEGAWLAVDKAGRKAMYYALRKKYWTAGAGLEDSALLYFLMKTGFNGIWQTCVEAGGRYGTPVGLAAQKGPFIDAGLIRAWSTGLKGAALHNGGYADIVVPPGAFVYCDPPYRDSFTTYSTGFNDDDQLALIAWCRTQALNGCTVWLSNRDAGDAFFETHAPDAVIHRFDVVYTAGRRKQGADGGFTAKPAIEVLLVFSPSRPAGA